MAKEIKAQIKLQIPAGGATPAPPVGSSLGQHGVPIMDFCKQFNAQTANQKGQTIPVLITVYKDRTFSFILKTPPVTELIKKKINLKKGSSKPHTDKVGKISWSDIEEIAKVKFPDLNAHDIEQAKKIIAGSARSMGVEVID
ncbi:MAG TPA: 50S ribosomal protein L11 [Candidatus Dependentiae bacterium]|nr:50S ribosomal protein L11 [Candidatus Dependentiae bacterium]HRQ62246.1 50S ribosomal protein L11 [Candidatus Dependentiae bacterium]